VNDHYHLPGPLAAGFSCASKVAPQIVLAYPAFWVHGEAHIALSSISRIQTLTAKQIDAVEVAFAGDGFLLLTNCFLGGCEFMNKWINDLSLNLKLRKTNQ